MRELIVINILRHILLLAMTCSTVFAFGQRIDVNDFYNFSRPQKVEAIKNMQMFSVNLEQAHHDKMSRKYSYQTLRFLLEKIVSKAVADDVIDNDRLCMYAGWLSYIPKNAKADGYCTHPKNFNLAQVPKALQEVIKKENQRYKKYKKEFSPNKCPGNGKIMCNPQLFGNQPGSQKPFCVVGYPNAANSSFHCLKEVEKHEKKEEILDIIIEENLKTDNGERLKRLISMIDDACMCNSPDNLIDQNYAKRLYKTQTCFSWVSQSRNIARKVCSLSESEGQDVSSIIDFSKKIYSKAQNELLATGIDSKEYLEIIENDKWNNITWKDRKDKYEDFCKKQEDIDDEVITDQYDVTISKLEPRDKLQPLEALIQFGSKQLTVSDLQSKKLTLVWTKETIPPEDSEEEPKIKDFDKSDSSLITEKLKITDIKTNVYATLIGEGIEATSNEITLFDKKEEPKIDDQEEIDDAKISISKLDLNGEVQPILAKASVDGKELSVEDLKDGYKILWYAKEEKTKEKKEEPKEDSTVSDDGVGDKKEDKKEEVDQDVEKLVEIEGYGLFDSSKESFQTDKPTISEEKQYVKAALFKGDKKIATSNEVDFKKDKARGPAGPPQGAPMLQKVQIRSQIYRGNR